LPLLPAIKRLMEEVLSGPVADDGPSGPLAAERALVGNARKIALFVAGAASQKYMQAIQDEQEVMGAIADIVIETYAMDSALLRTLKLVERNGESATALPLAMTRVYLSQAADRIESAARKVLAAVAEGDDLRAQAAILRRLAKREAVNTIALRQAIAERLIEAGRYVTN
jgi:butyryl-CoA dehydrogenase